MNINFLAASDSDAGNPVLNIVIFVAFIVITMTIVTRVGKKTTQAGDFYPSPSQMNCATCPYREACRSWRG